MTFCCKSNRIDCSAPEANQDQGFATVINSKTQKERNERMNELIEEQIKEWKSEIKFILLGSGESGKSTILKQFNLLHFTAKDSDIDRYIPIIYGNIVTSMGNVLKAMRNLGIVFENPEHEVDKMIILDVIANNEECDPLSLEVAKAVYNLWKDGGVKQCYERRNEFQLNDSAKHFFDSVERILLPFYRPTVQDMLCARYPTTRLREIQFTVKDTIFRVIDVGGQRTQRRKWMHCFDCVHAVIFVTAISAFNQTMREDSVTNRLLDSLTLFEYVCKNEFLKNSSIILFMNKIDLFKEKIENGVSISGILPEYKGKQDYDESYDYIKEQFLEANHPSREIYTHATCAIDCDQVQKVLSSCEHMIIEKNIGKTGVN